MPPSFTSRKVGDVWLANPVVSGYLRATIPADHQSPLDGDDILRGQFSGTAPVPARHVSHVFGLGAKVQVIYVATLGIVTMMVDGFTGRNCTVMGNPDGCVRPVELVAKPKFAIPKFMGRANPFKAPVFDWLKPRINGAFKRAVFFAL